MHTSKAAVTVSATAGKAATIIGIILIVFTLPFLIYFFYDMHAVGAIVALFFFIIPFLALGVFLVIRGNKIKHRLKRFRNYVSLMSVRNITSIDELASHTAKDVAFVTMDLQKMIGKKFFKNAAIDLSTNRIHIGGGSSSVQIGTMPNTSLPITAYECRNCGARRANNNQFCDYCGSLWV